MAVENTGPDTFPKLLLRNAKQYGDHPAIREKKRGIWHTTNWRQLADEVATLAVALSARSLQRGAHVAFVGDNRPRLYAGLCAAQSLGAIAMPLYQDGTAEELAQPIKSASVTHVFAENQEQVDKILEILPRCPSIRCIVYDKDRGMRHYTQPQLVGYDALLKQGSDLLASKRDILQAEIATGKGSDAAFTFFTSGTTGPAKGVVLSHGALIDRARVATATEGLTHTDVVIAYLPPGWIGQNLFSYVQPMVAGFCVCCPESSETMLADMREMGPTYFLATPRVLDTLLKQVVMRLEDSGGFNQALYRHGMAVAQRIAARKLSGEPISIGDRLMSAACNLLLYGPLRDILGLSRVRVAYTAGDMVDPSLLMFYRALGINLKQLYGSTETGFFVAMQRDGEVKPDTVGKAVEGVEIKLTPQREILVRSPGMFSEYHGDPAATARTKTADGWYRTGDAGYLGADGQLRIIDRMQYVGALSNGAPFSPKLIENKLKLISYIKEAVVFGDGRDRVCAFIDVDGAVLSRWADKRSITYTGHAELASRDEVYGLIGDSVNKINADLAGEPALAGSQIHRFLILPSELSADDGLLTRTGKLRRSVIAERYQSHIDAIYGGQAEVNFGNGAAPASSPVKIHNAKVTSVQARSAA